MTLKDYLYELLNDTGSPSTIKARVNFIMSIDGAKKAKSLSFLNNHDAVIKRVEDSKNPTTRTSRWTHINSVIDALRKQSVVSSSNVRLYNDLFRRSFDEKEKKRLNNVITPKDRERMVLLEDLQKQLTSAFTKLFKEYGINQLTKATLDRLVRSSKIYSFATKFQDLLLLSCYTFQPALRNNYGSMLMINKKRDINKNENFIYLGTQHTSKIIMNVYKTARVYGHQEILIRPKLYSRLKEWAMILEILIGPLPQYVLYYTITSSSYSHVSPDSLSTVIKKLSKNVFSKDLGINDYRKIWTRAIIELPVYQAWTAQQKLNAHKELLHGTDVAEKDYHKVDVVEL